MWKIFGEKCLKFVAFCILKSFTSIDVNALICLLTFQILLANQVKLTRPTTSLSNRFPNPSLSPTPWPKSLSATSYTHHHPLPPAVVLSFLSLTNPLRFRLNPNPNVLSSSTLSSTATKSDGFLFNHPSTSPPISPYSKISNPKACTPSLRSSASRRRVGNGFKDWKF